MKLFFYLYDGTNTSLLCTTEYYSQHYTEMLMIKILASSQQHVMMENIGFIGTIEMDNYAKVKTCIEKAFALLLKHVEAIEEASKEANEVDRMDVDEIIEKFFQNIQEKLPKNRRVKVPLVDLTTTDYDDDLSNGSSDFYWDCCTSEVSAEDKGDKWDTPSDRVFESTIDEVLFDFWRNSAEFDAKPNEHEKEMSDLRQNFTAMKVRVEEKLSGKVPWNVETSEMFSRTAYQLLIGTNLNNYGSRNEIAGSRESVMDLIKPPHRSFRPRHDSVEMFPIKSKSYISQKSQLIALSETGSAKSFEQSRINNLFQSSQAGTSKSIEKRRIASSQKSESNKTVDSKKRELDMMYKIPKLPKTIRSRLLDPEDIERLRQARHSLSNQIVRPGNVPKFREQQIEETDEDSTMLSRSSERHNRIGNSQVTFDSPGKAESFNQVWLDSLLHKSLVNTSSPGGINFPKSNQQSEDDEVIVVEHDDGKRDGNNNEPPKRKLLEPIPDQPKIFKFRGAHRKGRPDFSAPDGNYLRSKK